MNETIQPSNSFYTILIFYYHLDEAEFGLLQTAQSSLVLHLLSMYYSKRQYLVTSFLCHNKLKQHDGTKKERVKVSWVFVIFLLHNMHIHETNSFRTWCEVNNREEWLIRGTVILVISDNEKETDSCLLFIYVLRARYKKGTTQNCVLTLHYIQYNVLCNFPY